MVKVKDWDSDDDDDDDADNYDTFEAKRELTDKRS